MARLSDGINYQTMNNRDMEMSSRNFDQERQRNEILSEVNSRLKDQLNSALEEIENLKMLLRRESDDRIQRGREIEQKEVEWTEEKKVLRDFLGLEQNRLQLMWQAIASFKRQCTEMTSGLRRDVMTINRDMSDVIGKTNSFIRAFSDSKQEAESVNAAKEQRLMEQFQEKQTDLEKRLSTQQIELNSRISELTSANERLKKDLEEREDNLRKARTSQLNSDLSLSKQNHELEILQKNLKGLESVNEDIRVLARGVLEASELPTSTDLRSRSNSPTRHVASPSTEHPNETKNSTVAMIEAALQKRNRQLIEIQEKFALEKTATTKALLDASSGKEKLEETVDRLKADLEDSIRLRSIAEAERTRAMTALDAANSCCAQLDNAQRTLNERFKDAEEMTRRLSTVNGDLQRRRDELEAVKYDLEMEVERQREENFKCLRQLDENEQKMTTQTTELTQLRETNRRIYLERDSTDKDRSELMESNSMMATKVRDLESELSRLRLEKDSSLAKLNSSIKELQLINENLTNDKVKLTKVIDKLEADNSQLSVEKKSLVMMNSGIKEDLIQVERTRIDAEAQYSCLLQRFQINERQRSSASDELNATMRERNQLIDRLNSIICENQRLVQQLASVRQDHQTQNEVISRLKKEKEEFVRSQAELETKLESVDRDCVHLVRTLEQMKEDGEQLEQKLRLAQGRVLELEGMKRRLEEENEDLKDTRKQLQGDIASAKKELDRELENAELRKCTMEEHLLEAESEFQRTLQRQKSVFESDFDRVFKEKELMLCEFDSKFEKLKQQNEEELESLRNRLMEEKAEFEEQLITCKNEMEERTSRAAATLEQVMSNAEKEKEGLLSELRECEDETRIQLEEMETARTRFQIEKERDRQLICDQQTELTRIRSNFENASLSHEMEMIEVRNHINETERSRELMIHELTEVKGQLKVTEETRDGLRRESTETKRKLSQVEADRDRLTNELTELQQRVCQEATEKELAQRSVADLRNQLTKMEENRAELGRILEDFKTRLYQVETERQEVERDRGECLEQIHGLEQLLRESQAEVNQLRRFVDDHKKRLSEVEMETVKWKQTENETRNENNRLKTRLIESQKQLECSMAELDKLDRALISLKDEWRSKDQGHQTALDELRHREKALEDQCHNLRLAIGEANESIADLRNQLGSSEGRARGLEGRLVQVDEAKKMCEFKLCVVASSIKRTIGLRSRTSKDNHQHSQEGSSSSSPLRRRQRHLSSSVAAGTGDKCETSSADRETSPSPMRSLTSDIDPEELQQMVRAIAEDAGNAERERDDLASAVNTLRKRLDEAKSELNRNEAQMDNLREKIKSVHAEKQDVECRLVKFQTALLVQQQTTDEAEREQRRLLDRIHSIQQNLESSQHKSNELQEKRQVISLMENELKEAKRKSQMDLEEIGKKLETVQAAWKTSSNELEQVKLSLEKRDSTIQSLREQLAKEITFHENSDLKISQLQMGVDQLTSSLASATEERTVHTHMTETLHVVVNEQNAKFNQQQDKISHLERTLATREQESRSNSDKFFETRVLLNEEKQKNEKLSQEVQRLQFDFKKAEMKNSELQKIMSCRQSSEDELSHRLELLQSERENMIEQLSQVQRNITKQETTKMESERTKSSLERTILKLEREKAEGQERMNRVSTELRSMKQKQLSLHDENRRLTNQLQKLSSKSGDLTADHDSGIENEKQKGVQPTTPRTNEIKTSKGSQSRKGKSRKQEDKQLTSGEISDVSTTSSVVGSAAFPKSKVDRIISQMNELGSSSAVSASDQASSSTISNKTKASSSSSSSSRVYSPASRLRPNSCSDLRPQAHPSAK